MAVVIDALFPLELLDIAERGFRMRARYPLAERFVRVQQDFLEAARERHALVCCEILQQRGEPLFEPHGNVDAFDSDRWSDVQQVLSEDEIVAVEIADSVVAHLPRPVANRLDHVYTVGAMEVVQIVEVPDVEKQTAAVRVG